MIKFLILIAMTLNVMASTKIKDNALKVGKGDSQDIYIYGNNGNANSPFLLYDFSEGVWKQSNDGTTVINIGEGAGTFVDLTTNQSIAGEKTFTEAMSIQDNATPLSPLFRILSNDTLTNYMSVESIGISSDLDMTFNSTGALTIPVGDISERPRGATGMTRYNTEEECLELYNGTEWFCAGVGGGGSAGINFLVDSSFENEDLLPDATVGGTQTYPAYTIDSELYSEFNELYYNNAYTGLSASDFYVRDSFARTNYSQKDGLFSLYYKITSPGLNDVQLCLRVDDSDYSEACQSSYLVTLKTNGEWNKVEIPFVYGSSTVEYEIFNESFTGDITVALDNIYLGTLPDGYIQQVGQAQFVGSQSTSVSSCDWSSTGTISQFNEFSVDSDCTYSNTGQIQSPDTKKPAIKIPNARTDGYYNIKAQGLLLASTASEDCSFTLSSSSSYEDKPVNDISNDQNNRDGQLSGDFRFSTEGEKEIQILFQPSTGSTTCRIVADNIRGRGLFFTVHFYPDSNSTIVSQQTELTAATANELSAQVLSGGNTFTQNYSWIDSCSRTSTGIYVCDLVSNFPATQEMACVATTTPNVRITKAEHRQTDTPQTLRVTITDESGSLSNQAFNVICSKQGADTNKSQTIIGKFEAIEQVTADLTAATANSFTVIVSSSGVVTGDDYDIIDGNCTVNSTGNFTCNFNSGIFSEAPKCSVDVNQSTSPTINSTINSTTPTLVNYLTYALNDGSQSYNSRGVTLECVKSGADVNKSFTGAVINAAASSQLIADTVREDIISTDLCQVFANDNDNDALTLNVTDIKYKTETKDNCNAWNGTQYTAQKNTSVIISYSLNANTSIGYAVNVFKDGVLLQNCFTTEGTTQKGGTCTFEVVKDSVYSIRSNINMSLVSAPQGHLISITELPDTASIVENLNKNPRVSLQDQYSETEIEWGLWNGQQLYRRCFTVASDITTISTIVTWDSGLTPKGLNNYNGTQWEVQRSLSTSTNEASIYYDSSSGNIEAFISGWKIGAGTSHCMDYTR